MVGIDTEHGPVVVVDEDVSGDVNAAQLGAVAHDHEAVGTVAAHIDLEHLVAGAVEAENCLPGGVRYVQPAAVAAHGGAVEGARHHEVKARLALQVIDTVKATVCDHEEAVALWIGGHAQGVVQRHHHGSRFQRAGIEGVDPLRPPAGSACGEVVAPALHHHA